MKLHRNNEEEQLFNKLQKLIQDSDDKSFKKDVDFLFNDEFIMGILRCKKMRIDCALESVKKLQLIISSKYQDIFRKFHPEVLRHVLATPGLGPLRHRDKEGCHILTVQAKHWKVSEYSLEDLIVGCVMIGFEMAKQIETQQNGAIFIFNVEGFSFAQVRQSTPFLAKKMIDIIFHSLPLRIAGLHFTHVNSIIQVPLSMVRSLLPSKLKKRVHFHSHLESLHGHFPVDNLPQSLGGILTDNEAYDCDIMNSLFSPQVVPFYDRVKSVAERKLGII